MPDKITLDVAGHRHDDWLDYSMDSDLFTPADGWQVRLGLSSAVLPDWLRPWAPVTIRYGNALILTGRIDSLRRRVAKDAITLELSGRDLAAVLIDCSAPLYVRRDATLPEVCALVAVPMGMVRHDITPGPRPYKRVTVEPGMSAWDALRDAAEAGGLWPWMTPEGVLRVAAPDYTRPVDAELRLRTGGDATTNNVLNLDVTEDISGRYSDITVLGQSCGDEWDDAQTTIRGHARDKAVEWHRPRIDDGGTCDSQAEADARAAKLLSDSVFDSYTVTATVEGHVMESGALWEPGQRVHVFAPLLGLDRDLMLTRRTFRGGRSGTSTVLTLKPWGVWLPDTSKGAKKKKKKGDFDDWELDI